MKVTFDVDCTPEEARRFIGLPDLTPVHQAYVDKMQKTIADALTPDAMTELVKAWGPMTEAGMAMWQQMIGQSGTKKP
ncbi:MAG TPA: DUF6489 family protein [Allosphingosinicella sp.]|nr:DUF6489 family protein [Allosphingosinicella sp.]